MLLQAVLGGSEDCMIAGSTLALDPDAPYAEVADHFGSTFLEHFEASVCAGSSILDHLSFVDTPGAQDGGSLLHGYDFNEAALWFAAR